MVAKDILDDSVSMMLMAWLSKTTEKMESIALTEIADNFACGTFFVYIYAIPSSEYTAPVCPSDATQPSTCFNVAEQPDICTDDDYIPPVP